MYIWLCLHPRMIVPGKSKVEQETCFPALENVLRSQKHSLVWAGANPRFQTSFNEVKKEKYFWNSSGMFWLWIRAQLKTKLSHFQIRDLPTNRPPCVHLS